jgi:hypothetical protein
VERNFCLLILFSLSLLGSESFWFSYRVATDNKMMVYEEKNISPLMLKTDAKIASTCRVKIKKKSNQATLEFLNKNFNKILPCFYPYSSKIQNKTLVELKGVKDKSVLTILPIQFTVDFKDQFANIFILKNTN